MTKLKNKLALLSFCKATADAVRMDILRLLRTESYGVMELCRVLDTHQPGVSHHLKVLANAGLVQARREGNSIFYRRPLIHPADPLAELTRSLLTAADSLPMDAALEKRRHEVHEQRALRSREFFSKNAGRLKQNQDLIAEFSHYASCVEDLLLSEQWHSGAQVVEVGAGDSELIVLLSRQFEHILAIDNHRDMLNKTRSLVCAEKLSNVDLRLSDPADLEADASDLVVMNMVLHHFASPSAAFSHVMHTLTGDGRFLVIDLCPHDQDWVRDVCGDLWLGFEPSELKSWASQAGLGETQSAYIGLRNGFQVQVRLFQPTGA